jgi:hypothetical protein
MILEGIVTTLGPTGEVNIAPMGPRLVPPYQLAVGCRFELRPFKTARTYANLCSHPEGVLHVSDDVLLLARAAIGTVEPLPPCRPAVAVRGEVLCGACRACEFRVLSRDETKERATFVAEVVHEHRLRDFFGFNRAMHAVLEAAILATRTSLLPPEHIEAEYQRLAVLVAKTGSPREHEAFALLQEHVGKVTASSCSALSSGPPRAPSSAGPSPA